MKSNPNSVEELYTGVVENNKVILSQAITLIESTLPEDMIKGEKLLEKCLPHTGDSIRIGITGVPGSGKSTFIETFGEIITNDYKLAVLAIDPSSKKTKGSILGDKTRMNNLAINPNAFIRPSPSGKILGGVAAKTREVLLLCEAAGYKCIIVETVGVGQSETSVYEMVDFFLLLMLSGAGDELQGIKKGILEMADLIAINKADGDNKEKSKLTKTQINQVLHFFPESDSGIDRQVHLCSALLNTGIKEIWDEVQSHHRKTKKSGFYDNLRSDQQLLWMEEYIDRFLSSSFYEHNLVANKLEDIRQQVKNGHMSPQKGARMLINS